MKKILGIAALLTLLAAPSFAAEITAPPVSIPQRPGDTPAAKPAPGGPVNLSTMTLQDLTSEAEKGNMDAAFMVAEHYGQRNSLDADYGVAQKWYEKAAKSGNKDAQYKLGVMYDEALGVSQSPGLAYYWVALSASGGNKMYTAKKAELEKKLPPEQLPAITEKVKAFQPVAPTAETPAPVVVPPAPAAPEAPGIPGVTPPQQ